MRIRTKIEDDAENVKNNVFRFTGLNVEPYKVVNREDKKIQTRNGTIVKFVEQTF